MDKTSTVTDWSIKAITTNKTLIISTVNDFLKKDCDLDPQNPESKEYIEVLKSENLSNFFARRFNNDFETKIETNMSSMTNLEREAILRKVETEYEKIFVEYRNLYEIYVEKLFLLNASKKLRQQILASKVKDEYSINQQDHVRQSRQSNNISTKPIRATIKIKKQDSEQNNEPYTVHEMGHVSKSIKQEVKKAPVRARIK
ncbi:MAG: hypothetical protein E7159_03200 [Firmicutes bacterium]|nr:hypothetical protein [Bacillota bacterium]